MKKFIAAVAAVSLCAVMLAACSSDSNTSQVIDSTTASEATTTTTAAKTEEKTEEITKESEDTSSADNNDASDGSPIAAFASPEEFAASDLSSLSFEKVAMEDSNTHGLSSKINGTDKFYIDVVSTDGKISMKMAMENKKIAVDVTAPDSNNNESVRAIVIMSDSTIYTLDPSTMTGYYLTIDESMFNTNEIFGQIGQQGLDLNSASNADTVESCKVEIGGKEYIFESSNDIGILYEADGTPYAIIPGSNAFKTSVLPVGNNLKISILMINEFSGNVPSGMFDIPSDYTFVDLYEAMAEALAGLSNIEF